VAGVGDERVLSGRVDRQWLRGSGDEEAQAKLRGLKIE